MQDFQILEHHCAAMDRHRRKSVSLDKKTEDWAKRNGQYDHSQKLHKAAIEAMKKRCADFIGKMQQLYHLLAL